MFPVIQCVRSSIKAAIAWATSWGVVRRPPGLRIRAKSASFSTTEIWQLPLPPVPWRWRNNGLGEPKVSALAVDPKSPSSLWAVAGNAGFAIAIVAAFAIGVWASAVTSRDLGVSDHGGIVIDEIAAFLLVLFFVGAEPIRVGVAFLLFRFFDIVKLPPAREIDRNWHGGLGVMLDDVVAAGYALVVFAIVVRLQGALGAAA